MGVRMITINFDKAKDITKDRLRTERKPMLESLDVVQLRNLNNPEVLAQIEAKKQALRDATSQVDTMTTLDELKAASLPVLE
jgi:L-rhamnose isomerase